MATLITASGEQKQIDPANGGRFTLDELNGLVGGDVEILLLANHRLMVLNEDGKGIGLPRNPSATVMAVGAGIADEDFIVGDVLICDQSQID